MGIRPGRGGLLMVGAGFGLVFCLCWNAAEIENQEFVLLVLVPTLK